MSPLSNDLGCSVADLSVFANTTIQRGGKEASWRVAVAAEKGKGCGGLTVWHHQTTFPSGHTCFTAVKVVRLESRSRLRSLYWNVSRSLTSTFGGHLGLNQALFHKMRILGKKSLKQSHHILKFPKKNIPHTCNACIIYVDRLCVWCFESEIYMAFTYCPTQTPWSPSLMWRTGPPSDYTNKRKLIIMYYICYQRFKT